jgi:hypothetical protein
MSTYRGVWSSALLCLLGCATEIPPESESPVSAAEQTLEANATTRELHGIVQWTTASYADTAQISGRDGLGATVVQFELQTDIGKNAGGFEVVTSTPQPTFQVRDVRGRIVHNTMPADKAAMLDAFFADTIELANRSAASDDSLFAYKDEDICSWCGFGGTQSKCYGVVLMCQDLDICGGGGSPDDIVGCNDWYPCGVCIGLPF